MDREELASEFPVLDVRSHKIGRGGDELAAVVKLQPVPAQADLSGGCPPACISTS